MAITEVTTTSWFSRIGNSFKGILVGLLFVVGSVVLLFWNEGRSVKTYKSLKEGSSCVVSVEADSVDPANSEKLIHLGGRTATTDILEDKEFNISVSAVKLKRQVEMYQWNQLEEEKTVNKVGGGTETTTVYSYEKIWNTTEIDSSGFKESGHDNPKAMPCHLMESYATHVTLGAFDLSESLIYRLGPEDKYSVDQTAEKAPEKATNESTDESTENTDNNNQENENIPDTTTSDSDSVFLPVSYEGEPVISVDTPAPGTGDATIQVTGEPAATDSSTTISLMGNDNSLAGKTSSENIQNIGKYQIYDGGYYLGANPNSPQIGDVRVSFWVVNPGDVSIVAMQQGNSLVPYKTKTGSIELLENGLVSAATMFENAQSENRTMTWILRIIGAVVMFIGFKMLLDPLKVLADILPIAGTITGVGTSIISFFATFCGSLLIIGIAWLFYRPVFGISLLVLSALVFFFVVKKNRGRNSGPATSANSVK